MGKRKSAREKEKCKVPQDRVKTPGDPSCCLSCAFYNRDLEKVESMLDSHDLSDAEAWYMGVDLLREADRRDKLEKFLLERGAKSETPLYWNGTPLCHAVGTDSIEIMESLLKANRGVNKPRSINYLVPLSMAVQFDDTGIAKVLLDHIYRNKTPPHCSNVMNNLETIKSLLHASVNVDERLYIHLTGFNAATRLAEEVISEVLSHPLPFNEPFLHKTSQGEMRFLYEDNLTKLLQENADVEARTHDNLTPLHLAAQLSHPRCAEILLDHGADVSSVCAWAMGRLLIAAVHAQEEPLVKLLLEKGADVNTNDKERGTPLKAAVYSPSLFKLLLSNGADIDARDEENKTILRHAVENENLSLIELIIEAHSDPESPMGKTQSEILEDLRRCGFGFNYFYKKDCGILFHTVIRRGHIRIFEYLLNLGTNFNVESKAENGDTPLYSAVTSARVEIARLLIKNKADVNAKTRNGATPLHYAFEYFSTYVHDEENETPRTLARKRTEIIKMLLDKGALVNAKENDGTTVLGRAVKSGPTQAFKLLIENGADIITDGNNNGETLLHMAAEGGSAEIVEIVLNAFDDVDCKDGRGETSLHVAVSHGRVRAVCLLLDHDSDINILGEYGATPLSYANYDNYYDSDGDIWVGRNYLDLVDKIAVILKQHIVKMIALNRWVSDENLQAIDSFDDYERIHDQCKAEIECMRQKKISVSNVSYYDVLTKGMKRLALYARNKDIVDALETGDHKDMFRLYSGMLHNRFKKGQKRAYLLDAMENSLSSLGYSLPDLVTTKLFDYLSNKDLKNLIKAGFNEEFFKFLDGIRSAESRDC